MYLCPVLKKKKSKPLVEDIFDKEDIRSKPLDFCLLGHSPEDSKQGGWQWG